MKTSEDSGEILAAFCKFQEDIDNPKKNKTAHVQTNKGSDYEYSYISLDALIDEVQPVAKNHELSFNQEVSSKDNKVGITTYLFHESGQWLQFGPLELEIIKDGRMNKNQATGSTITYARRYALAAMAGIASEEDTDTSEISAKASGKGGNKSQSKKGNGDDYNDLADGDGTITDNQQKMIFNLFTGTYDLKTEMADEFVGSIKQKYTEDLSMQEASNLITLLKQKEDKAQKMIDDFKDSD